MKHLTTALIFFLAVFNTQAHATSQQAPATNPVKLCDGNSCSEPMLNIIDGYKTGIATFADQDLTGYSGKCFHLSPQYSPDHAHYGGFAFDKTSGSLMISGMFGFFYSDDPYTGMTAEEMKEAFAKSGSQGTAASTYEDHIELAHVYETTDIRYWYRSDESKQNMFVIGRTADTQYGMSSAVFCKMVRH